MRASGYVNLANMEASIREKETTIREIQTNPLDLSNDANYIKLENMAHAISDYGPNSTQVGKLWDDLKDEALMEKALGLVDLTSAEDRMNFARAQAMDLRAEQGKPNISGMKTISTSEKTSAFELSTKAVGAEIGEGIIETITSQPQTGAGQQPQTGAADGGGAGSKMGGVLKSLAGVAGMALASYGVDLLIQGIDKLIVTTDEHREQLAGLKNDYSGVAAALDNVNAQAAQTESRLESIAEGGVTEQEQQEYDQLIEERAGQTEDKAFLSASERAKQEAVRAEFAATMKSAVGRTVTFTNPSGTVDTTNIAGESAWRAAAVQMANNSGAQPTTKTVTLEDGLAELAGLTEQLNTETDPARLEELSAARTELMTSLGEQIEAFRADAEGVERYENPKTEYEKQVNAYLDWIDEISNEYALAVLGDSYVGELLAGLIDSAKDGTAAFEAEASALATLFNLDGVDTKNGLPSFLESVIKQAEEGNEDAKNLADSLTKAGYLTYEKAGEYGKWAILPKHNEKPDNTSNNVLDKRLLAKPKQTTIIDDRTGAVYERAAGNAQRLPIGPTGIQPTAGGGRRSILSRRLEKDLALAAAQADALQSLQSYYREGSEEWMENQRDIADTYRGTASLLEQEYERLVKKGYTMANEEMRNLAGELLKAQESVHSASEALWNATRQNQIDTLRHTADQVEAVISLKEARHDLLTNIRTETRELEKQYRLAQDQAANPGLTQAERDALFSAEDYAALTEKLNGIAAEAEQMYADYQRQIASVGEDATEQLRFITAEYERQYGLKLKQYETVKAELALTRAQKELENVRAERNVAMLVNGQWSWVADPEAVKNAMESVADAEASLADARDEERYSKEIAALEAQKNGYEAEIAALEALEFTMEGLTGSVEALTETIRQQVEGKLSKAGGKLFSAQPDGEAAKLYALARGEGSAFTFAAPGSAALPASPAAHITPQNQQVTYDNRVYIDGMELAADQSEALIAALRLAVPAYEPTF